MECPKCGGTTGFICVVETLEYYVESWDGQDQKADSLISRKEAEIISCIDCDARFRRSTIEKLRAKEQL